MIEFSLFSIETKNRFTVYFIILGSIIISLLFIFTSINPGIFILILIAYIFYQIKKDVSKPIGKIHLSTYQIGLKTELNDFQIDSINLANIELIYSGHSGKRMQGDFIGPFNSFSGTDNYIRITNYYKHGDAFNFRFLVENSTQENQFMELIKTWENLGFDVSNIKITR